MFNSYKYQKYKYKYTQLKRSISQSGGFNVQFILFGDVMTGHDVWFRDEFGNNIDFIERLQSIGDVIILKPNYVNFISYTNINNPKDLNRYYKTNDTNIFFHLNDLQFEIYADWVYKQINPNKQYIAIGLEQGAHFAKFFCNQYASNCISLYIIIDRIFTKNSYEKTFESEQNYEKLREFTGQQNIEKYKIQNLTDETIQFILHHIEDTVPEKKYLSKLDKAQILRNGSDVTIVANSLMTIESMKAAEALSKIGVDVEIVDLRSIKPIDLDTILKSVSKTKNLVVVDSAWKTGGISGEIISLVVESSFDQLEQAPLRITSPDHVVPTSHYLADEYYNDAKQISQHVLEFLGKQDCVDIVNRQFKVHGSVDVPNREFHGPF